MTKNLNHLFKKLPPVSAPSGLSLAIMQRIRIEERRAALRAISVLTPVVLLSLAGILWALISAANSLSQTGFWQYVSLVFSDTNSVLSLWYPFMLSILDSMPFFALTVLVGALATFVGSAVVAAKSARSVLSFA